ncbi:MAG: fatty acid--CoA ligase family protein [Novosphingobium sp.]
MSKQGTGLMQQPDAALTGTSGTMTPIDRNLADYARTALASDPARLAIEYGGHEYTWADVRQVAEQLRRALDDSGAGAWGAISFVARNRPSALAALAEMLAGARTVRMIYPFQSPSALAAAVARHDSPVLVMAEEDFTPEVDSVLKARRMAGIGLAEMGARFMPGHARAAVREAPATASVEILTSGTTGPPKQFAVPHGVFARFVEGQGQTLLTDPTRPPMLFSFPIGNISGMYMTCSSFLRGEPVILLDRFTLPAWLDYVRRYRPTTAGAPPAAVSMILDAGVPREDLASLDYFSTGAAPLDPTVQRRFQECYGIPVLLSYGATEFGGPVVAMTPALHAEWGESKFGSVGRAMPGVRLAVRDPETGAEVPAGETGLLEVVSPRLGPDWIRTSDLVSIDADGFMFCRGRNDGAIMRGGFKVLPEPIERALMLHPAIADAAVVAVPDARLSEVPGAVVQIKAGAARPSGAELADHLRRHVLATYLPAHWRFVDALPKNPSFKIDRPALKALFDQEPVEPLPTPAGLTAVAGSPLAVKRRTS